MKMRRCTVSTEQKEMYKEKKPDNVSVPEFQLPSFLQDASAEEAVFCMIQLLSCHPTQHGWGGSSIHLARKEPQYRRACHGLCGLMTPHVGSRFQQNDT